MYRYYDIHTHQPLNSGNECFAILNRFKNFDSARNGAPCSIGIHPWYLHDYISDLEEIKRLSLLPNVLAIGECGLDKLCGSPWDLQLLVFKQQILLANSITKPLIIHCVRAFRELSEVLKEMRVSVPVIIHGYNKKIKTGIQLLEAGYYLSFGAALLAESSPGARLFAEMPEDRFFLETDDSGLSIKEIYEKAAQIRKTGEEGLILQVQENFKTVFGL
jgi:TatD DNase family protein